MGDTCHFLSSDELLEKERPFGKKKNTPLFSFPVFTLFHWTQIKKEKPIVEMLPKKQVQQCWSLKLNMKVQDRRLTKFGR